MAGRMFELVMTAEVHDLDAVGVEAVVVDQPLCQRQRLRRPVGLDVDLTLQTFEAVAVGIAEILVEGDTIRAHLALLTFRRRAAPYSAEHPCS